eukprot:3492577-Alexandrium_andersonii.AAC.1
MRTAIGGVLAAAAFALALVGPQSMAAFHDLLALRHLMMQTRTPSTSLATLTPMPSTHRFGEGRPG